MIHLKKDLELLNGAVWGSIIRHNKRIRTASDIVEMLECRDLYLEHFSSKSIKTKAKLVIDDIIKSNINGLYIDMLEFLQSHQNTFNGVESDFINYLFDQISTGGNEYTKFVILDVYFNNVKHTEQFKKVWNRCEFVNFLWIYNINNRNTFDLFNAFVELSKNESDYIQEALNMFADVVYFYNN